MNEALFRSRHEVFIYELKQGTSSSYYLRVGKENILPARMGFSQDGFMKIQNKGRSLTEVKKGQITASFRNDESSPYKKFKPFRLFSSVWQALNYPLFVGYGDIGTSNKDGRNQSTKDLFIIYKPCKNILEIHLFWDLMEGKEEALNYLEGYVLKKQKPMNGPAVLDINEF